MSQYVCRVGDRNSGGGSVINGINSVLVNGKPIAVVTASNITPHPAGGGSSAAPTPATIPAAADKTSLYSPQSPFPKVQNAFSSPVQDFFGTPVQDAFNTPVYDAFTHQIFVPPYTPPPPPPKPPTPPTPPVHAMGTIVQGDRTVLINNYPAAYITSTCRCGHVMISGSNNVMVGAK